MVMPWTLRNKTNTALNLIVAPGLSQVKAISSWRRNIRPFASVDKVRQIDKTGENEAPRLDSAFSFEIHVGLNATGE